MTTTILALANVTNHFLCCYDDDDDNIGSHSRQLIQDDVLGSGRGGGGDAVVSGHRWADSDPEQRLRPKVVKKKF